MDADRLHEAAAYSKTRRVLRVCGSHRVASKRCMEDQEHWMELCRQASVEQDPKKLLRLVTEINRILAAKQNRLKQVPEPDGK